MMGGWATTLQRWDNPETVRLRKYLTGTHLLLQVFDVETAATPREVVWASGPVHLVRYRPRTPRRYDIPVMLVYPPILRSYILDLVPGVSLVEYLLDQGFDVYLLDFGVATYAERRLTLEDYVLGYLSTALHEVKQNSGTEDVTVVGHCMAGSMGAMYAAAVPEAPIHNLVLVAAPIDFVPSRPGLLGTWTLWTRQRLLDPEPVIRAAEAVRGDQLVRLLECAATGRLSPSKLDFPRLSANPSFRSWLAICRWVDDGVPFPGTGLRQWYRDLFQHNSLIKGEQRLSGERVELANITCPVLAIAGTLDAVTPFALASPWPEVLPNSDVDFVAVRAGHVGMITGPAGPAKLWPALCQWLAPRSGGPRPARSLGSPAGRV